MYVITKGIFKALRFSHDYYVPGMITSAIINESESCMVTFLCVPCTDTTVLLLV